MGYTQPYEYLKKFKTIKFNNLEIIVQKNMKYLSYIYGADWKTPKNLAGLKIAHQLRKYEVKKILIVGGTGF